MKTSSFLLPAALVLASLLGGCGVYAPSGPPTPILTRTRPVELTASGGTISPAVLVAVAPRPRLLVLARGAAMASRATYEDFPNGYTGANTGTKARLDEYRQHTLEIGAGYHSDSISAAHPYFSFLGGGGRTHVNRTYFSKNKTGGLFGLFPVRYNSEVRQYTHAYYSLFVQGQTTYYLPASDWYYGTVVRFTQLVGQRLDVRYVNPSRNSQLDPPQPATSYLEGAFFLRSGIGRRMTGNLKLGLGIPLKGTDGYDRATLAKPSLLVEFGLSTWLDPILRVKHLRRSSPG